MMNSWRDARYALRTFAKHPGFAAVAIFTLALGIGASTAIFSVIHSALLYPYPYKNVDKLATFHIHFASTAGDGDRYFFGPQEFLEFQKQNHVFADMVALNSSTVFYSGKEGAQTFTGGLVTPNAFEILGIPPLLGRRITIEDGKKASPPVFVMSYAFWAREFQRDPKILGTSFQLNGEPRTLVAVMPPRFTLNDCELWIPVSLAETGQSPRALEDGPWFWPLGVLKPGVSVESAGADIDVVAKQVAKVHPAGYLSQSVVRAETFTDSSMGDIRALLFTLMGAAVMLLLIACSNVGNLLLSRATSRAKEMAIRASVGASQWRLVKQLLLESLLLAIAGCVLGCLFAYAGLRAGVESIPKGTFPSEAQIGLNPTALFFALGVSILTTLLCGVAPALHAVRGDLQLRANSGGKGMTGGLRQGRMRAGLVIAEVALSITLLIGSGLMMRSLLALERVKLGFDPTNVLCLNLQHPGRYASPEQKRAFFRRVLNRIKPVPGVISASEAISLPLYPTGLTSVLVPGQPGLEGLNATSELCSEEYFRTMGIPLLRGRLFEQREIDSASPVMLINQAFARSFFGTQDPIGQKIRLPSWENFYADWPQNGFLEIIGVVGDTKNNHSLKEPSRPQAYLPYTMSATGLGDDRLVIVKTGGNAESLFPVLRRAILEVDSTVAVKNAGTIASILRENSYSQPRFGFALVAAFAGVGLLLVIVGVSSVTAYTVSLRTREIGIRMALGAQQKNVLRMVLGNGLTLIAAGTVIGVSTSLAATRLIASQIWGVSSTDALTFSVATAVILGSGLLACLLPARKASRVDPMVALHYE